MLSPVPDRSPFRRAFAWLFRDRATGDVTIAQVPNLPLVIFLAAAAVRRFVDPAGTARTVVSVVAGAALLWWAADEIIRGVNPFRRFLGAVVAVVVVAGLLVG